ncbi:MAG: SusC/RagA family TonB-linked outer membrane protein, partial [Odoribacter splanchnicus]
SVSGGSEDIRYYVSLGYNHEDGVTKTTKTDRMTSMANLDINFMKNLQVRFALNANIQKKNHLQDNIDAMNYAYNTTRALPAFNEDGSYYFYDKIGYGGTNQSIAMFRYNILNEIENSSNEYDGNTVGASIDGRYTSIVKGLDLTLAGSYSRSNTLQENWWGEKTHYVARYKNAEYEEAAPKTADGHCLLPYGGILNTTQTMTESYTLRTQLDYRLLFGEDSQHMFSAMGGFEMNGNVTKQNSDQIFGYLKDRGMQIVSGIDLNDFPDYRDKWLNVNHKKRTHSINHELSGYVTLGYSYKQHFTLNANARTDASNAFGSRANEKLLPIWSVSGMWNAKENLLRNVKWVSNFALRASYGLQGNMQEDQSPNLIIRQGTTDPVYNENLSTVERYPNPNLQWEQTRSWDLGLDFGLFNDRLTLGLSYYDKKTEDCFTTVNVSTVNGVSSYVMNGGSLTNQGYSAFITGYPVRTKDWTWNLSVNWSGNINEVRSGAMDTYTYADYLNGTALVDGEPIETFYSYKFIGLDPKNGVPMFDDYSDRRHLLEYKDLETVVRMAMDKSGSRTPKFSGSFSTSVRWKGLTLSGSFAYSLGSKVRLLSIYEPIMGGVSAENNVRKEFLDRWQVSGDETKTNIPSILSPSHPDYTQYIQHYSVQSDGSDHIPQFASTVWNMYDNSDLRVVSGNYLRCSSLSLRYNFEPGWLERTPFSNASVSLSALNLFTVSARIERATSFSARV